jgi:hypothetical protein
MGITTAVLNHVTMTLADVQMHLRILIKSLIILLGHSIESADAGCSAALYKIAGLTGTIPRNMRACIDLLKCAFLLVRSANRSTLCLQVRVVPSGLGANSCVHTRAIAERKAHTHGDRRPRQPRRLAWQSAIASDKTVARSSDAEVFDGLRRWTWCPARPGRLDRLKPL